MISVAGRLRRSSRKPFKSQTGHRARNVARRTLSRRPIAQSRFLLKAVNCQLRRHPREPVARRFSSAGLGLFSPGLVSVGNRMHLWARRGCARMFGSTLGKESLLAAAAERMTG